MATIPFVKMHGIGNDFVVFDAREREIRIDAVRARALADRRFGIGCDQVLLIEASTTATARMRVFNPDGSEVAMCGNGLRCVARYLRERDGIDAAEIAIETDSGPTRASFHGTDVRVDLGTPVWEGREIPVDADGELLEYRREGIETLFSCVSMGNPHTVLFVTDLEDAHFERLGPALETHAFFPERTNVEFVQVLEQNRLRLRVWERGVGETLACGSGAAAAGAVALRLGRVQSPVSVELPGGTLEIAWDGHGSISLTGPAEESYRGEVDLERLTRST